MILIHYTNSPTDILSRAWLLWPTAYQQLSLNGLKPLKASGLFEDSVVKDALTTAASSKKYSKMCRPEDPWA